MAKLLFGIGTVSIREQRRMVNRACKEAARWHDERTQKIRGWVKDMERYIQLEGGICPECTCRLGEFSDHKYDCSLKAMVISMKK